jgi:DNA-binding response OmpR family regulator
MAIVLVISKDWLLRAGLRAELREHGVEALGFETTGDAAHALEPNHWPSLIVVEASEYPAVARWREHLKRSVPVLVVASGTESVQLLHAADMLVRRPVRIGDLVAQIQTTLKGIPA